MVKKVFDFLHDLFKVFLKVLYVLKGEMNFLDLNFDILFVHLSEGWKFDLQMADFAGMKDKWSGKEVFFVDFLSVKLQIGQLDDSWDEVFITYGLIFDKLLEKLFKRELDKPVDWV